MITLRTARYAAMSLLLVVLTAGIVLSQGQNFPSGGSSTGPGGTVAVNTGSVVASGLQADWRFLEGTGTTVADASGKKNNLTFCTSTQAPIWYSPNGVAFTGPNNNSCIQLPTALTSVLSTTSTVQILFSFDSLRCSSGGSCGVNQPSYVKQYLCLLCSNGGGLTKNAGSIILFNNTGQGTSNDLSFEINSEWTNGSGGSTTTWPDTNSAWNGTGVLTYVINPAGNDSVYINGVPITAGTGSIAAAANNSAPFLGNFFFGYAGTGFTSTFKPFSSDMILYRALVYNRALTTAEIQNNTQAMNYFAGQTSYISSMPCCMGTFLSLSGNANENIQKQDQFVLFDDSVFVQNAPAWMYSLVLNGTNTWSLIDSAVPGQTLQNFLGSWPYSEDPLYRYNASRNLNMLCYGNDLTNSVTPQQLFGLYQADGEKALSSSWIPGVCTLPTRTAGGFDANRDAFNTLMATACPNPVWCPMFFGIAQDYNIGVDGGGSNTTYFTDGVHLTPTSLFNNSSIIIGRDVNRYQGNKSWATANTYTTAGTNTVATTAASESGNIATITTAGVVSCLKGSEVVVSGVTPAGYNTPAGQDGWYISGGNGTTTISYYDFNTGLGAQTGAGTIHCAQQVDADDHLILAGSALTPAFYLESCIGTTSPVFAQITNATSTWILTPWSTSQTINGGTTFTVPLAVTTNHPVIELDPIPSSPSTAGCTWQAHIQ